MSELDTLRELCAKQQEHILALQLQLYGPIGSGQGYRADQRVSPPDKIDASPVAVARGGKVGPKLDHTLTQGEIALAASVGGFTGNVCLVCHNFTMRRVGPCETCVTCGATTGCS